MKTSRKPSMYLQFRKYHIYLGTVFSPLLIFFALTGSWMIFDLHAQPKAENSFSPPSWMVKLSQVHKSQKVINPEVGVKPAASPLLFRCFILIAAIGLINNSLTGIFMAYKFMKNKRRMLLMIGAGCIIPILLFLLS